MAVNIKLPDGCVKTGMGTKVFTESGEEIENIRSIDISIKPDCIITANIEVCLGSETDLDGLLAQLGYESLEEIADTQGYRLEPKE